MSVHRFAMVALLGTLLLFGGFLSAQDKAQPVKGTLPPNWGKIGLSDEQKQKVYKIQADYDAKTATLKAQLAELDKKEKAELEAVLTPDQKKKLKEIIAEKVPGAADDKKPPQ